jgi:hypothetical protein
MPNWSEVRGLIAPVTIGVAATAALGYSTNELTGDGPKWWWLIFGTAVLGLIVAGLWGRRAHRRAKHSGSTVVVQADRGVAQLHAGGAQQAAGHHGTNVVMSADNQGVVAWKIDTFNMGARRDQDDTDRS